MADGDRTLARTSRRGARGGGGDPSPGLFARLVDWLYRLLNPSAEDHPDYTRTKPKRSRSGSRAAEEAAPPPEQAPVVAVDHAAVNRILSSIQKRGIRPAAGKVQMVNLGDARDQAGPRWRNLAERAMALAEMVLSDRLDPSDVFTRYRDHAFIVVFGELSEREAAWHAEAISREICLLLMQDKEFDDAITAEVVTARIDKLLPNTDDATVDDLDRALDDESDARKIRADLGADNIESEPLSTTYRPMLHVPNQTVGIFAGLPRRRLLRGEWVTGCAAYPQHGSEELVLAMDLLLVRRVIKDAQHSIVHGNETIIGAMANLRSLSNSQRILNSLAAVNALVREHLVLEMVGVVPTLPVSRIVEVAGRYRSVVKAINLRISLLEPDVARYAPVGAKSIGCDLSAREIRRMSDTAVEDAIGRFVRGANAGNMYTHFLGVDTDELFSATVAAGATFVTGDAIAPFVSRPTAPYRFDQDIPSGDD
jgi:hypothetical protein